MAHDDRYRVEGMRDAIRLGEGRFIRLFDVAPDGATCRGVVQHPRPDGSSCVGSLGGRWTIVQREPLTLSPSLHCQACGDHGWIREGRWVPC